VGVGVEKDARVRQAPSTGLHRSAPMTAMMQKKQKQEKKVNIID